MFAKVPGSVGGSSGNGRVVALRFVFDFDDGVV
jgi:hypothetical protein